MKRALCWWCGRKVYRRSLRKIKVTDIATGKNFPILMCKDGEACQQAWEKRQGFE